MNYRHIYHAGNFADLVKHALLLSALGRLQAAGKAVQVIDTHAGAGLYDLDAAEAKASGEAAAGVARLMADPDAPPVFGPLREAVRTLNRGGVLRRYPGSPQLAAAASRPADRLIACELRADDHAVLSTIVRPEYAALREDGFRIAPARVVSDGPALVLIDPPFEEPDDYVRVGACAAGVLRRNRDACVMIWTPLKDLETFDAFLRRLEGLAPTRTLVAEARLRPLDNPMRLNGCAVTILNDPPGTEEDAAAACAWVARRLGEPDGRASVWRL